MARLDKTTGEERVLGILVLLIESEASSKGIFSVEIMDPGRALTPSAPLTGHDHARLARTKMLRRAVQEKNTEIDKDEAKQIGPYELEKKIGEGGIGEVYLARHALLRRPAAIKLLKKRSINPETLDRFEREVRQTSRLTHPNTVEIYDYGHTPTGTFYYAMEYLPGLTMAQLIQEEGAIVPRRVVHLLDQVCASLSEAHAKGLIHRDIKPQNIMLCERGGIYDTVKVLDFGLVKDVSDPENIQHTAPDQLGGTPMYIAPERIRDPSRNDARTDLYAVGTVAYNLLTGSNPLRRRQ